MKLRLFLLILCVSTLIGCVEPRLKKYNHAILLFAQQEYSEALAAFLALANNGYAPAQFRLGLMYLNGLATASDPLEAVRWFSKAADQGHLGGQYSLSKMYLSGVGVKRNPELGFKWLLLCAEQGFAPAQYQVALMYANGQGTELNNDQAVHWFKRAGLQKHRKALLSLSQAYRTGALGLPVDQAQAQYWQDQSRHRFF